MLFNTPDFIIFFVSVSAVFFFIKSRNFQHIFLISASYFFFYYSSNYLIILLIYSTLWDFYLGKAIWNAATARRKKILFIMSLSGNLGLLGFFKYADFAIMQFNVLGNYLDLGSQIPLMNLALPIGISFYTFHSVGYIIDIYRGHLSPAKSLREYAIFIAFFPQLVAGPILRARQFLPQLQELGNNPALTRLRQIVITSQNLKFGTTLMAIGFFKKMFIADNVAPFVNDLFGSSNTESFSIILGALAFGIQIYLDFSGYSDIAIGAAKILGFEIPINFNKPYFATSPSDFWRRWHISLSSWLKDYLYVSLGGNRKSRPRTYLNLLIVMFLGGLWHGASWNFVIWGMLHGVYLAVHKFFSHRFPSLASHTFFRTRAGVVISIIITQYFVFLAWLPFRIKDTHQLLVDMQKYVFLDFSVTQTYQLILQHKFAVIVIVIFIILYLISYKKSDIAQKISNMKLKYWTLFLVTIIISILFFYNGRPEDFIYFKF